jgi:seryl-tRNA synthetase
MNIAFKAPLDFKDPLAALGAELFRPMNADGVYARTGLFEQVIDGLSGLISRQREPGIEILRFPPVMSRRHLERSGYLHSFPHFLGCVSCLQGEESDIRKAVDRFDAGENWATALSAADLVLSPAACYPVYPLAAERGRVPPDGLLFDVNCDCFRREPSRDLDRLQSFRMREFVCIGAPEHVADFRDRWVEKGSALADRLGLTHEIAPASDPFFGRGGKMMAANQVEQALKFELLVPIRSPERPTACMSFNYHREHFGKTWELRLENGDLAHTVCVAFGLERLALALFATHGLRLRQWPAAAREALDI